MRGAWIEMLLAVATYSGTTTSLPVRGAWIEMQGCLDVSRADTVVAPRAGSVD